MRSGTLHAFRSGPSCRVLLGCCLLLLVSSAACKSSPPPTNPASVAKSLRDRIEAEVDDDARKQEALAELERAEQAAEAHRRALAAFAKSFAALGADYHTPRAEFETLVDQLERERRQHMGDFVRARLAMRSALTEEEWKLVAEDIEVMRKKEEQ